MKIMVTAKISTLVAATGSLIPDILMMTTVECLHPLRGADHSRPGSMMKGAHTVMSGGSQSTHESQGVMRGRFSFKVWST